MPHARFLALAVFLTIGAAIPAAAAAAGCNGADPSIVGVHVGDVTNSGGLDHITVTGRVQNVGSKGQPGNMLQRVDYLLNGTRTDTRTIQPLAAGASQPFSFTVERAAGAGQGTSRVTFYLEVLSPQGTQYDCNAGNDKVTIHI